MASVARRGDRWRARFRDAAGKEYARHFDRKVDAQRWLDEQTASQVRGDFVAPGAGRVTFKEYAEDWRRMQLHHRETTREQCESRLRKHVYPVIGDRPLQSIRRSDVQNVVNLAAEKLAPATVQVVYAYLSAVLKSATHDRLIPSSPCVKISLPQRVAARVQPLTVEQVSTIAGAVGKRYRAMVIVAAGSGLRGGELRGLTIDRISPALHLAGDIVPTAATLTVDRQLLAGASVPAFGPPKTPAADRRVKVGASVVAALVDHIREYGVGESGLVFTSASGSPITRSTAGDIWRTATSSLTLRPRSGWHDLRHFHASLLIADGRSVRSVADRLGHADPAETLRTYAHLWPDDEDRAVRATEAVLEQLA